MKPEDFGYVVKNNLCLFTRGPLSQWWGGFKNQTGGFSIHSINPVFNIHPDIYEWCLKYDQLLDINCCEQWMMLNKAALFGDVESFEKILNEKSPSKQKDLGRTVKGFQQEVWDVEKFLIVYDGNFFKFNANEELRNFLLSFNPHTTFVEAAPWDSVWGIGLDSEDPDALDIEKWKGQNLLGKALSMVRDVLLYVNNSRWVKDYEL